MVSIPGHNYRRSGSSPSFTFVVFLVVITIMLGIYCWSLNSENKSLKTSMLHTYTKLKQVANAKVNAEKRNTVLSNKMVHMEEERDSAKETVNQEKSSRDQCEKSLSTKDQDVDDAHLKLKRILDEVYPDRTKPNSDNEQMVEKVSDTDVSTVLEEIKTRKMSMASLRQDYMMLQNKFTALDKELVELKHKLEKCESTKVKKEVQADDKLETAHKEVESHDQSKVEETKEETADVTRTTPALRKPSARGNKRKPSEKAKSREHKRPVLGIRKTAARAKQRRSQASAKTLKPANELKSSTPSTRSDAEVAPEASGTTSPVKGSSATMEDSSQRQPTEAVRKGAEGKLERKHILDQLHKKQQKLEEENNEEGEESPEQAEDNEAQEEEKGDTNTVENDTEDKV